MNLVELYLQKKQQKRQERLQESVLKRHIGHKIVCVGYGHPADPANVTVECEDCNEVLMDIATKTKNNR